MGEKATPTSSTTNSSSYIDPWLLNMSQSVGSQAMSGIPQYTPYTGPNTQAGMTGNQTTAYNLAGTTAGQGQAVAGTSQPTYTNAMNFGLPQTTAGAINGMTNDLVNGTNSSTQALIAANDAAEKNANAQGLSQLDNNLASNHAFGGTRQAVADANLTSQNQLGVDQQNAALLQSQTQNAQGLAANTINQNNQNALSSMGINLQGAAGAQNLGSELSGLNTADIGNLSSTGGTAQTTQSGQNQFDYNQYLQGYQIPDTQYSTLASILGSLPHDSTAGSTTQSQIYTNPFLSLAGLGLGVGALYQSDIRTKTDITRIGVLFDGTAVYRFRYKGHPRFHIGIMAQDVEEFEPAAVHEIGGTKFVDYKLATERAARAA